MVYDACVYMYQQNALVGWYMYVRIKVQSSLCLRSRQWPFQLFLKLQIKDILL